MSRIKVFVRLFNAYVRPFKVFVRLFFAVLRSSIGTACTIDGVKVTPIYYSYWLAKELAKRI